MRVELFCLENALYQTVLSFLKQQKTWPDMQNLPVINSTGNNDINGLNGVRGLCGFMMSSSYTWRIESCSDDVIGSSGTARKASSKGGSIPNDNIFTILRHEPASALCGTSRLAPLKSELSRSVLLSSGVL